jgi:hypothetical protein
MLDAVARSQRSPGGPIKQLNATVPAVKSFAVFSLLVFLQTVVEGFHADAK